MNVFARALEVLKRSARTALVSMDAGGACRLPRRPGAASAAGQTSTCRRIIALLAEAPARRCRAHQRRRQLLASWVHRFFPHHGIAKGHKTQLAPTNGAMGYGVPAGIAANLVTGRTAVHD